MSGDDLAGHNPIQGNNNAMSHLCKHFASIVKRLPGLHYSQDSFLVFALHSFGEMRFNFCFGPHKKVDERTLTSKVPHPIDLHRIGILCFKEGEI
jgi:hypothetical protein